MTERRLHGLKIRLLQVLALYAPGSESFRIRLHRARGVRIGERVFVGTDAIIETSSPELVWIGDGVAIGMRATIIAHFRDSESRELRRDGSPYSVRIEDDVSIGPGAIILPNVTVGHGAVVTAGSVVTRSVPPMTMVQGNPARAVARCGVPLGRYTPVREFYRRLQPIR